MIDIANAFALTQPMLAIVTISGVLLNLGPVLTHWPKLRFGFRILFDKCETVGKGEVKPFSVLVMALSAVFGTPLLLATTAHSQRRHGPPTRDTRLLRCAMRCGWRREGIRRPTGSGRSCPQALHHAQADAPASTAAQLTAEQRATQREFWASVKTSEDSADIRAYLEQFPVGSTE